MDKDDIYKRHILDAIAKIERYINGVDQKKFAVDELVQDGVVRELEIIGEAVKRLSAKFKTRAPELPWKAIAGTRDILIHEYISVDVEIVWKTIKDDLPILKAALLKPEK
ncbi:MAG: DUF86 domain-containing protein [Patescibacteria group bacterium]